MRGLFLVLFLLAPAVSAAVEVKIGARPVQIPNPTGFSPVTPEMHDLHALLKEYVPPDNLDLVTFVADSSAAAALEGNVIWLERRFSAQTNRSRIHDSMKSSDFARVKEMIKTQNRNIMQDIERHNPDMLQQITEYFEGKAEMPTDWSVSQIVPFPPHEDTDQILSHSTFFGGAIADETGNMVPYIRAGAMTLVHVKGKVLYLYTYAHDGDIEWCREASSKWAQEIVQANQSVFDNKIIYGAIMALLLLYLFVSAFKGGKAKAR